MVCRLSACCIEWSVVCLPHQIVCGIRWCLVSLLHQMVFSWTVSVPWCFLECVHILLMFLFLISAQMAGLLCEEEGPEADNVKYCGYCKHHYNKLVRTATARIISSHRNLIPILDFCAKQMLTRSDSQLF